MRNRDKDKDKKHNDNLPPIPKSPSPCVNISLNSNNDKGKGLLNESLSTNHIQRLKSNQVPITVPVNNNTNTNNDNDNNKDNTVNALQLEITKLKQFQSQYEHNLLTQYEQRYSSLKEIEAKLLQSANEDIAALTQKLQSKRLKIKDLKIQVLSLQSEVDRLSNLNQTLITTHNAFNSKLKTTTELFESFLLNNKELLSNDLYFLYHDLKQKFEGKIKECLDAKGLNSTLQSDNRVYRLSMDTNQGILNQCAKMQIEAKRKAKLLKKDIEAKAKLIEQMRAEYKQQFVDLETRFNMLIKESDEEVKGVKAQLKMRTKELNEMRNLAMGIVKERSEVEVFFNEAIKEVKKEVIEERKVKRKGKGNRSHSHSANGNGNGKSTYSKEDESMYLNSAMTVDIKDISPEHKEKLLRLLLTKLSQSNTTNPSPTTNITNTTKIIHTGTNTPYARLRLLTTSLY